MAIQTPAQPPVLEAINLTKSFAGRTVLRDVSLSVGQGEVAAVVGASGAGKSTLLSCINHLEPPDAGLVLRDGRVIETSRRANALSTPELCVARATMPMVFQQFNLFGNLNVLGNVVLAQREVLGRSKRQATERAVDVLTKVGLRDQIEQYPDTLSGGQAQRVGIARAIAMDPDLLLLDEPTSALDPNLVGEVVDTISQLADEGMTMIIVTHEMTVVRRIATTVHLLGDGEIIESAPPATFFSDPREERTHKFVASILSDTTAERPTFLTAGDN